MAGQSVGFVTGEQTTVEILGELVNQALAMLASRDGHAARPTSWSLAAAGEGRGVGE
jgi:hypothetical protein